MFQAFLAIVFVVFLWWSSTGFILYLDGLPTRTYRWSVLGATVTLFAGLALLVESRNDNNPAGAYLAFSGAMIVWGWNELLFLTGFVTGPRRTPCPEDAVGWRRVRYAVESILYHEIALLMSALLILLVTASGSNQLGLATFALLWVMRLSTKLNVYFGVPNLSEEFLPAHLKYLATYFARKPMNLLFPVSVTLATLALVRLIDVAGAANASEYRSVAATLPAILLALAILEHWFLVLPLQSGKLWTWGLASHKKRAAAEKINAAKNKPPPQQSFQNNSRFLEGAVVEPIRRST